LRRNEANVPSQAKSRRSISYRFDAAVRSLRPSLKSSPPSSVVTSATGQRVPEFFSVR
jgi:hypothetical protein